MAEIRLAGDGDRGAVEEVVGAAYGPWVAVIGGRPRPLDADYAALIADRRVHVVGEDGVDGLIVLLPESGALLVENVAVRPALHGRGIGRRLLGYAEDEARRLRLPVLRLYTHEKMGSNLRLYQRLGYVETGREPAGGGHVVHLSKPLTPT